MTAPPRPGSWIEVTGARRLSGIVLGSRDDVLIVAEAPGRTITLRRDCASTLPDTWRYGGMPVSVRVTRAPRPQHTRPQDFSRRLALVEKNTRTWGKMD